MDLVADVMFIPIHKERNIGGCNKYNKKEVFIHFELKMYEFLSFFEKVDINCCRSVQNDNKK